MSRLLFSTVTLFAFLPKPMFAAEGGGGGGGGGTKPTIPELTQRVTTLESENQRLTGELATANEKAGKVDGLQEKLTAAETKATDLQGKLTAAETKATDLQGKLTAAETKSTDLQTKLTGAETERDTAKQEVTKVREYAARHSCTIPAKLDGASAEESGKDKQDSKLTGLQRAIAAHKADAAAKR